MFPGAPVKIFLTASAETRARRRNAQNVAAGLADDYDGVLADVRRRDHPIPPGGVTAPQAARDAVIVDTSDMTEAGWSPICWSWSREVRRAVTQNGTWVDESDWQLNDSEIAGGRRLWWR